MDVLTVLLLGSLGLAITAQDCSRPIGGPDMNLKGEDILLETFPDGTRVTFACNVGFRPVGGSADITCTAGTWSPLKLKCEKKNCGSAGEVENGQITYKPGTEFGDKAVVICNYGYNLVGREDLTCGDQGWDGRLPFCEVMTCEQPPTVVDGTFSPNKDAYEYREVVRYTCKDDRTLNGSRELTCSEDGTFKPQPPKCVRVECREPDIQNGKWSGGSRPPYKYKSSVTLVCLPGYVMNGTSTIECDINSQWSPRVPGCIQKHTTTTTTTTNTNTANAPSTEKKPTVKQTTTTTTTPSTSKKPIGGCVNPKEGNPDLLVSTAPPYTHMVTVNLQCSEGYQLDGSPSQKCEANGEWSPGIPKCIQKSGSSHEKVGIGVGVGLGLGLVVFGLAYGVYKNKGTRRGNTDKEAPKDGEDVALS